MTRFKGCIDIHDGQVKQIVGSSLQSDKDEEAVTTNFVSTKSGKYFGKLYRENNVEGTHIIKLGKLEKNTEAALDAISQWPGKLQIGGGINIDNAKFWLDSGAGKVIVTSWLFPNGVFSLYRLKQISELVGRENLVIDLSCKKKKDDNDENKWYVCINKWTQLTDLELDLELFAQLSEYCSEFLVHAADVEGMCKGIELNLVAKLGEWFQDKRLVNRDVGIVYAGGAKALSDLNIVKELSKGKVDLTFGSALDIFGGKLVKFADCVQWNKAQ